MLQMGTGKENSHIIRRGPFKGKRIVWAPTTGVDAFGEISVDFMRRVFAFEPGDYLITDESSLRDFTDNETPLSDLQSRVNEIYGVDIADIPKGNLLEIFRRIHSRDE